MFSWLICSASFIQDLIPRFVPVGPLPIGMSSPLRRRRGSVTLSTLDKALGPRLESAIAAVCPSSEDAAGQVSFERVDTNAAMLLQQASPLVPFG